MDFAFPADHRLKLKEREKRDKYLDFARELKKLWSMKMTVIPIVISRYNPQKIGIGTGGFGNKRTSEDYPDYSIIKIGQDTEKSPGDVRRLAVT